MAIPVEQFGNSASTTLSAGINSSVTAIPVTSGSPPFPAAAQFRIRIDNELMIVTAGAGTNSWTATRGAEGTTAASHSSGATVRLVVTKGTLDRHSPGYTRLPRHHNLRAWNFPIFALGSSANHTFSAQRTALAYVPTPDAFTISKVWWGHTATSTTTATTVYACVYNLSGTLIGKSAEMVAGTLIPAAEGPASVTITAESGQSLVQAGGASSGVVVGWYLGTVGNFTIARAGYSGSSGTSNMGLTIGTDIPMHSLRSSTDASLPPSTINFLSAVGFDNQQLWAGLS